MERTLVLLKPDAVQRRLVGRIISRFEDKGLKIVGMKLMQVTPELAERHYDEHREKPFFGELVSFITSSPIVAMVVEGPGAIDEVRKLMGKTNPRDAAPGTIRGDWGLSITMNLVHGSDSPASAAREIPIFFSEDELLAYSLADAPWLGG
ncbi:TPA: nucleoside-diphosphate kinase [Candidatus Bipolaricaulota bacterium]|nr:nucleoside-diphosphate kinase [Candidatus Bipolaricaulota bacterium]HIP99062.1 nucleoside-diphosphate kinase [Candidatus Bipolaricaulota bacterium]